MNKNLETFDLRNFLDRLTPKKGKNRYICPVCEGSLTVDIKTGKYQCWGEPGNKQHLKDIDWAEELPTSSVYTSYSAMRLEDLDTQPDLLLPIRGRGSYGF